MEGWAAVGLAGVGMVEAVRVTVVATGPRGTVGLVTEEMGVEVTEMEGLWVSREKGSTEISRNTFIHCSKLRFGSTTRQHLHSCCLEVHPNFLFFRCWV